MNVSICHARSMQTQTRVDVQWRALFLRAYEEFYAAAITQYPDTTILRTPAQLGTLLSV